MPFVDVLVAAALVADALVADALVVDVLVVDVLVVDVLAAGAFVAPARGGFFATTLRVVAALATVFFAAGFFAAGFLAAGFFAAGAALRVAARIAIGWLRGAVHAPVSALQLSATKAWSLKVSSLGASSVRAMWLLRIGSVLMGRTPGQA
jgi:hypothetical protein